LWQSQREVPKSQTGMEDDMATKRGGASIPEFYKSNKAHLYVVPENFSVFTVTVFPLFLQKLV